MITTWEKHVGVTEYENVRIICSPLKQISIDGFFYMKIFPDGSFIDLTSNLDWTNHYFSNFFQEKYDNRSISDHIFMEENISIWTMNPGNELWQEGFAHFQIKDGVSITFPQEKHRDIFCFYICKNNLLDTHKLINLTGVLKQFCEYFLEKASWIIALGNKNKLITPLKYRSEIVRKKDLTHEKSIKSFYKTMSSSQGINLDGFKQLSQQECKCIRYASEGLSSELIGKKLCLSRRTVESYIISARNKTNCKNLTELVFKYYYFNYML